MKRAQIWFRLSSRHSFFYSLGRFIYHYRWWMIALWAVLMMMSLTVAPLLEQTLTEIGAVYQGGKAYQAERLIQQELGLPVDGLTLVFQQNPKNEETTNPESIQPLLQQIQTLPGVKEIVSAEQQPSYRSADGTTQHSLIYLNDNANQSSNATIAAIEHLLQQYSLPTWQTFLTGIPVVNRDIQQISREDLRRVEVLVLPLILITLLIVFGSVIAAMLPILMAIFAISITFGLLYLIALKLSVSVFSLNLASMLGLGLGIDYSLLIVNRFREELSCGSTKQALARTLDTAGKAVFFSGLTVAVGLVCLLLFPIALLQSLGIAGSLVVLLSVATALTLLPALLAILGKRLQQPIIGKRFAFSWEHGWKTLAKWVIRYSIPSVFIVLMIVAGVTAPFLQARFGLVGVEVLPAGFPARTGTEVLQRSLGAGAINPILLLIQTRSNTDSILSQRHLKTLYEFVRQLQVDPRVKRVNSLVSLNSTWDLKTYQQLYSNAASQLPLHVTTMVKPFQNSTTLVFNSNTNDRRIIEKLAKQMQFWKFKEGQTWITTQTSTLIIIESLADSKNRVTRDLVQSLQSYDLDGLKLWVTGQTAKEMDTITAVSQRFPLVVLVMMGITFIILSLLLESIILPLKAIVMNLFSIGASFGSLVFIFQEGNFRDWLDFTPPGYLDILLPIVLFCVLFGLSMDYEVFLLSRIKEAYDESRNNTESVIKGLQTTGGIITSAALLMIIVTSAFVMARIIFVKALGLGSAIAVLIDVTLIRAIMVPATIHLLGKWNWWFPSLNRRAIKLNIRC